MPSNDPNQNPYQPMAQAPSPPPIAMQVSSYRRPSPHYARLGFFNCFFEAKTFLGTDYWLFWGLLFVAMVIATAIPLILAGPMYCGIGICFLSKELGFSPSFDLLFKGFDNFVETLTPVLLYSLGFLFIIPIYMGGVICAAILFSSGNEIAIALGACLYFGTIFTVMICSSMIGYGYMFSSFLVAEYRLDGMEAFKVSLVGIRKNLFGLLGVSIASVIVTFCAVLPCGIPAFLMLPIFVCAPFICYRKIFRPRARSGKKRVIIEIPD